MIKFCWILISSVILFISKPQTKELYQGSGKIDFISSAPLETITASSEKLKGIIDLSNRSFAFTLPVNSFNGFNSQLQQEHFNENYMESTKYPKSTFVGNILDFTDCEKNCEIEIIAKGKLTIHGLTKVVTIPVLINRNNDQLNAKSNFDITLSDFDIEIPLILEGKISSVIQISVDVNFIRKSD